MRRISLTDGCGHFDLRLPKKKAARRRLLIRDLGLRRLLRGGVEPGRNATLAVLPAGHVRRARPHNRRRKPAGDIGILGAARSTQPGRGSRFQRQYVETNRLKHRGRRRPVRCRAAPTGSSPESPQQLKDLGARRADRYLLRNPAQHGYLGSALNVMIACAQSARRHKYAGFI